MDDSYYRQLFENVGFALIATDAALVIREWNHAATRMFGASAERMVGTPLLNIVPADQRDHVRPLLERALSEGEVHEFEIAHRDAHGNAMVLGVVVAPVVDGDGHRIGVSASLRDSTRRVELERRVAAERTMAALGSLSKGIAHHFNNLLGGMATSVDFALSTGTTGAMRRTLQLTAESVARAARITQSLLVFAVGDARGTRSEDLTDVLRGVVEERRPDLEAWGGQFEFDVEPVPPTPVSAERVRVMLGHLLDNALEAMPDGGTLRIGLRASGRGVHLVVEDTGVGISPPDLERVMLPFFTTKGALGGGHGEHLGLGLAVVHGVVRELDGTVSLDSRAGQGTRVEVVLPIEPAPPA